LNPLIKGNLMRPLQALSMCKFNLKIRCFLAGPGFQSHYINASQKKYMK
jgi:hypothetical protein